MTVRLMGLASLLAAGAATLAIAVAPIADAARITSFGSNQGGMASEDRAPSDVEINSSPSVQFPPLYPDFGSRGIYHHGHHHH